LPGDAFLGPLTDYFPSPVSTALPVDLASPEPDWFPGCAATREPLRTHHLGTGAIRPANSGLKLPPVGGGQAGGICFRPLPVPQKTKNPPQKRQKYPARFTWPVKRQDFSFGEDRLNPGALRPYFSAGDSNSSLARAGPRIPVTGFQFS